MFVLLIPILLLFSYYGSFALSEVYHITPSVAPAGICPGNIPCTTLTQFAVNYSFYAYSDITLVFADGKHKLNSEILIKNITKLSVFSISNSSSSVVVSCAESAS